MPDRTSSHTYLQFDDATYVRESLAGNRTAFDALVRQYTPMVYSIAISRLNQDNDAADELCQEVFLRAWLHLEKLSRPDLFPSWLVQIARNLAVDWLRHNRRRSGLVQMMTLDHRNVINVATDAPNPRDLASNQQEIAKLKHSLNIIPPEQRDILLWHYVEGLSLSDIARFLRVNPSTVMRRLKKASHRLKTLVNGNISTPLQALHHDQDRLTKQTLGVIGIAWLLPSAQRTALAQAANQGFASPLQFNTGQSLITSTGGKIMSVTAGLAVIAAFGFFTPDTKSNFTAVVQKQDSERGGSLVDFNTLKDQKASTSASQTKQPHGAENIKSGAHELAQAPGSSPVSSPNVPTADTSIVPQSNSAVASPTSAKSKPNPALGKVTGQVVDTEGNPVSEVRIEFAALTESVFRDENPAVTKLRPSQPVQQMGRKRSAADGKFEIPFPTTGTAILYTDHQPYVRTLQRVDLPTDNISIVLTKTAGANVSGVVKDLATDSPVANADVLLGLNQSVDWWTGDRLGMQSYLVMAGKVSVKTDHSGTYTVDRLPSATLQLNGWADAIGPSIPVWASVNGAEPLGNIEISAAETKVLPDLYLYPGYTMQGHVIDADTKAPIAGATVGPPRQSAEPIGKPVKPVTTDEKGFYELKQIRAMVGKPRVGEPQTLMLSHITAIKDGYKEPYALPQTDERQFDPTNLTIYQDFALHPGTNSEPSGGFRIGNRQ